MNLNNLFKNKSMSQTVVSVGNNTVISNSSIGSNGNKSVIVINGVRHEVEGNNISVRNGSIYVDNNLVVGELKGIVEIKFEGSLANLSSDTSVSVNGNVEGKADSRGSMTIQGDVKGSASSGGSMSCKNIGNNASSGGSMTCGNVGGNASSGGSMRRN